MYGFNPYKLVAGFLVFVFFTGIWVFLLRGSEDARQAQVDNYMKQEDEFQEKQRRAMEDYYAQAPSRSAEEEAEEPPAVLATVHGRYYYKGDIEYPAEEAEVYLVRGYADSGAALEAVEEYLEENEPVYYGSYEEGSPEYEEWRVEAEYRMHERFVNKLRSDIRSLSYYTYGHDERKVYEAETDRFGEVTLSDVEPGDYLAYCIGRADDRMVVWVSEVSILEGEVSVDFETSYTVSAVEEWEY